MVAPLQTQYTTAAGPGYSAEQSVPSASLGGYAATTAWAGGVLHDLFNAVGDVDARDLRSDYRAVYVWNPDPSAAYADVRVYLAALTAGAAGLAVGLDPRPVTMADSLAPQGVDVATAYTPPTGVTFTTPAAYAGGLAVGTLPAQSGRVVWVRRTPAATPPGAPHDAADLVFEAADGSALVRRLYWETAPYADRTRPLAPPAFVPTPSPFTRVTVDYLTPGGARVTWELDRQLVDAGPYVFQLQASQSGGAGAADWADVGPPARDAVYLVDPDQRMWGMSTTLTYRVVLTTAAATYASPVALVYGNLTKEAWLLVRELFRKEELMMRRFVGLTGFLLKARRYGTRCPCTNAHTGEVGNSADPVCYGTGFVGGYHAPIPLVLSTPDNPDAYEHVGYNESVGTVRNVDLVGRVLAAVPVVHKDAWAAVGSDERYYCHKVKEVVRHRGVPVVYEVSLRLAPRSDVLYSLDLERPVITPPEWQQITNITV